MTNEYLKMNVQIDGVGFVNKGAELMLRAVVDQITQRYPEANLVWGRNNKNCSFKDISALGIYQWFDLERFGIPLHTIARILRMDVKKYGLIHRGQVDVLLDAAGFQFGDQRPKKRSYLRKIDRYYSSIKRKGTKIIFLPQAFGPFKEAVSLSIIRAIATHADLICARDAVSYDSLMEALNASDKIQQYPDFTNLVPGRISKEMYETASGGICVIPNSKMVTHTDSVLGEKYIEFLKQVLIRVRSEGKRPFLLNHGGEADYKICEAVRSQTDSDIQLFSGFNALEMKGIIGSSYLVISSRFHGASSALSQGVPCLVTSWSHKYPMLLKDYDIENGVLDVKDRSAAMRSVLRYVEEADNLEMRKHLSKTAKKLKAESEKMWAMVFEVIERRKDR
jgi:colanic acid/amylovoran biosynthesis protein